MSDSIDLLMVKARSFISAIHKLPRNQKTEKVSPEYAEDYNRLRMQAVKEKPELETFFPPSMALRDDVRSPGTKTCDATYVEIETYAMQIRDMLLKAKQDARTPSMYRQFGSNGDYVPCG